MPMLIDAVRLSAFIMEIDICIIFLFHLNSKRFHAKLSFEISYRILFVAFAFAFALLAM